MLSSGLKKLKLFVTLLCLVGSFLAAVIKYREKNIPFAYIELL